MLYPSNPLLLRLNTTNSWIEGLFFLAYFLFSHWNTEVCLNHADELLMQCAHQRGWTPLCVAAMEGLVEVIEYLISKGADVHHTDQVWNLYVYFLV